jgi:hypothetical protein
MVETLVKPKLSDSGQNKLNAAGKTRRFFCVAVLI